MNSWKNKNHHLQSLHMHSTVFDSQQGFCDIKIQFKISQTFVFVKQPFKSSWFQTKTGELLEFKPWSCLSRVLSCFIPENIFDPASSAIFLKSVGCLEIKFCVMHRLFSASKTIMIGASGKTYSNSYSIWSRSRKVHTSRKRAIVVWVRKSFEVSQPSRICTSQKKVCLNSLTTANLSANLKAI